MTIDWKPIQITLSCLDYWQDNPKLLTKPEAAKLEKSTRKLGRAGVLLVGPDINGRRALYDGHQRANIWRGLYGLDAPIWALESSRPLSDDERRAVSIMTITATGSLDWQKLAGWDFAELQDFGMDGDMLKALNNDANNLKELMRAEQAEPVDASEEIESADRFEEVQEKWKTEEGQVWKVGRHTVYCGDCLDIDLSLIEQLDIVIADPPYGVNIVAANGYVGGGEAYNIPFGGRKGFGSADASKPFGSKAVRGSDGAAHVVNAGKYPVIIGDENTDIAKKSFLYFSEKYPKAIQAWWGANYYTDAPLPPSQCWLVWNKETTGNFADCEIAYTNMDKSARLFTHQWNGMLRASEREKRWHPTQKPAALAAWILEEFTKEGAFLLDPFGGAGWTILAAQKTNRTAYIIEKLPAYVAVILERMATAFPELEIKRISE